MAGERSVRISFEARQEISSAVEEIDASLDRLKGSLGGLAASMEMTDPAAEDMESDLDEIGDEAGQATVKLGALAAALNSISAGGFDLRQRIPIDIDKDDVADEAMETRQVVKAAISGIEARPDLEIEGTLDRDELLAELKQAEEEVKRGIDADLPMDIDLQKVAEEAREAERTAEAATEDIDIPTDINLRVPTKQKEGLFGSINQATREVEASHVSTVDIDLRVPAKQAQGLFGSVNAATTAVEGSKANNVDVDLDVEVSDELLELAAFIGAMEEVQADALRTALATRRAAGGIDEMGDEASETAAELTVLESIMKLTSDRGLNLSVNIGAFNVSLSQVATQIPILVGLIGSLTTALAGLASAALLAAVGMGAIVAAGLLTQLSSLEKNMAGIENRMEALQAVMKSLAEAFEQAVAPLTELNGASQLFFDTINGLLTTVNAFAQGIADSFKFAAAASDDLMSLNEFIETMGDVWFNSLGKIVQAVKTMSANLLPIFADLLAFFIRGFDDMIFFITKFTKEFAGLAPVFLKFLDFAVQLIELTSTILQGLLPVFVGIVVVAKEVAQAFNALDNTMVRNIAGTALLAFTTAKLFFALKTLFGMIMLVVEGTALHTAALVVAEAATWAYALATSALTGALAALGITLGAVIVALSALAVLGALVVGLLSNMESVVSGLKVAFDIVKGAIMDIVNVLLGVFISIWNDMMVGFQGFMAVVDAITSGFERIASALGFAGDGAGMLSAVWNVLVGAFKLMFAPIQFLIDALGKLAFIVGGILAAAIDAWISALVFVIGVWIKIGAAIAGVIDAILKFIGVSGGISSVIDGITTAIDTLIGALTSIPQVVGKVFNGMIGLIEDTANAMIKAVNDLIRTLPQAVRSRLGIQTIEQIDLQGPTDVGKINREDVVGDDTKQAKDQMEKRPGNNFNYDESNISNISQEVNADPENKEALRRVIKDAMAEANAFQRRNQGHGG